MSDELAHARLDALSARVDRFTTALAEYTTLARSSASGAADQVNYPGDPTDSQRPVRRVSPWGHAGRPVAGVFAGLVKAVAGAFNGMVFGVWTDKYGPQDLVEGETCLYCKATGTRVFLDQDGAVRIDAASGQTVQVNGSTYAMPKWDDFLTYFNSTFLVALKADLVAGALGGCTFTSTTPIAVATYKSTKAKNG